MSASVSQRRSVATANAPTDAEIMRRLATGELGALGELYDRYHGAIRRFVDRATAGGEDVDDLVHQIFLGAASAAERYDGRACCRPWLIGIAVHHLRRRRQRFGRWFKALGRLRGIAWLDVVDPRPSLHARTDLDRALAALSEAKRLTFLLAEVEGMTGPEIAAQLGLPIGTVWTRLHAARRELRAALDEGDVR